MSSLRTRVVVFIGIVQSILFLLHWSVCETWILFRADLDSPAVARLQVAMLLASISFVIATLLAHRHFNFMVRLFYRAAAVWLGFMNFFFLAACVCWVVYLGSLLCGVPIGRRTLAAATFGLAALTGVYGLINARRLGVKRIAVHLPNLPQPWRGRVAALISDVHLGHINGRGFMRRIVLALQKLGPDVVFIAGDLFDGSHVDAEALTAPWREIRFPLGAFFVTGNHEEFSDPARYLDAVERAGIRVLRGQTAIVDGLRIAGVLHGDAANPDRFRAILEGLGTNGEPVILLSHVPRGLQITEAAGVSLLLCGHTHGGQIFPFTWFTARIFGAFRYGMA